jgi:hypothetical protein
VYPVRVGSVGALAIEPPEVNEPAVTAEPPFELYVTVYEATFTVIVVALDEIAAKPSADALVAVTSHVPAEVNDKVEPDTEQPAVPAVVTT